MAQDDSIFSIDAVSRKKLFISGREIRAVLKDGENVGFGPKRKNSRNSEKLSLRIFC